MCVCVFVCVCARYCVSVLCTFPIFELQIAIAAFTTYILIDPNNVLDASKAFVSISFINLLNFSLLMLPEIVFYIGQVSNHYGMFRYYLHQVRFALHCIVFQGFEHLDLSVHFFATSYYNCCMYRNIFSLHIHIYIYV